MSRVQRIVLEFRGDEISTRILYTSGLDGPGPSTKRRRAEVRQLAKDGLACALGALDSEADAVVVGASGFTRREDVLLLTANPTEMPKGA